MEQLAPGTPIASPRLGYMHHGIYVGDGRVIHYAGFNRLLRTGPVEEVPLERFTRGRSFSVQSRIAPKFPAKVIVNRARSRLGEDHYRLWSNNCEHFVSWCLSDTSRSAQVEAVKTRIDATRDAIASVFRRGRARGERRGAAALMAS